MIFNKLFHGFLVVFMVVILSACGGGSEGNSENTTLTGVFEDDPVDGVFYKTTSGKSGLTSNGGKFSYISGDNVTFYVGESDTGLELGSTKAQSQISPLEIFNAGDSDSRVINMARFLQSLDDSSNNSRITVSSAIRRLAEIESKDNGVNIKNFFNVSTENFEGTKLASGDNVGQLISIITVGARGLVDADTAKARLQNTISKRNEESQTFSGTIDLTGTWKTTHTIIGLCNVSVEYVVGVSSTNLTIISGSTIHGSVSLVEEGILDMSCTKASFLDSPEIQELPMTGPLYDPIQNTVFSSITIHKIHVEMFDEIFELHAVSRLNNETREEKENTVNSACNHNIISNNVIEISCTMPVVRNNLAEESIETMKLVRQ